MSPLLSGRPLLGVFGITMPPYFTDDYYPEPLKQSKSSKSGRQVVAVFLPLQPPIQSLSYRQYTMTVMIGPQVIVFTAGIHAEVGR